MLIFFIRYPGDGWGNCLDVSQSAELVLFEKGMVDIDNVLKCFLFLIKLLVFIIIFQFGSSPDLNNLVKT